MTRLRPQSNDVRPSVRHSPTTSHVIHSQVRRSCHFTDDVRSDLSLIAVQLYSSRRVMQLMRFAKY